jgi:nuclease HARBI1
MTADELFEMVEALEIPPIIMVPTRSIFSAIKALCLTSACFRTAGDIYELSMKHLWAESAILEIVNWMVMFMDET